MRQEDRATQRAPSRVDLVLAMSWLAIPGIQYVGAYVRAGVQLDVAAGRRTDLNLQGFEALALLDLTPLYALLLAATVVSVVTRWLARRRAPQ